MRAMTIGSLLIAIMVAACASSSPDTLYLRQRLTAPQLDADSDVCMAEAKVAERSGPAAVSDGTAGGAFAAGMAKGAADIDRLVAAYRACFMRLGYREQTLTPEQKAEFGALRTREERGAYIVRMSAEPTP